MRVAISASIVALMVSTAAVSAADMSVKAAPRQAAPIQAFSWSGCYLGAHGGYAGGSYSLWDPAADRDLEEHIGTGRSRGWLAGVQAGCDYQVGAWVFGSETDFSWARINGSFTPLDGPGADNTHEMKADWLSTSTVRVGYAAWDRVLLYAKGGLAIGSFNHIWSAGEDAVVGGLFSGPRERRLGYTVGAGLEYAFAPNWSIKAEYNYMDFGTRLVPGFHNDEGRIEDELARASNHLHVGKIGLNYRFNPLGWGNPVVARY
jgi:outer membrane immunogenic protein